MRHAFRLEDSQHSVDLSRGRDTYRLHLGDTTLDVKLTKTAGAAAQLSVGERHFEVVIATRGDDIFVHLDGGAYQLRYWHPLDRLAAQSQGSAENDIRAPMPGRLVALRIAPNDVVTRGQLLIVIESMKMESSIVAPRDGVVAAVHFEQGQTFDRDALLMSLAPDPTTAA